ncbi:hypothetical protein BD408DRAFT_423627 [Parasitella parasitica]|nr:hypothetical protein BD408DRAFT_423627 [Parasitella parasitica]
MITELDSLKTREVSKFLIACIKRIESYDIMYEFYNRGLRSSKLKFRCYRKKQKAFSEIVKMFTHDSIKYRTGVFTNVKTTTRNNNSYSRPPPLDGSVKANKTIIAYGDGRFSPTMRGKSSGPKKTIIKALQKCKENCGVTVQMVDEYLTSQVCNNCKKRNWLQKTSLTYFYMQQETTTLVFHHSSVLNQKNNCKHCVSLILLFDTPWHLRWRCS